MLPDADEAAVDLPAAVRPDPDPAVEAPAAAARGGGPCPALALSVFNWLSLAATKDGGLVGGIYPT